MERFQPSFETKQAASHIIIAIVESNIDEREGMTQFKRIQSNGIQVLKKTNRVSVSLENKEVSVKINLVIRKGINILEEANQLQRQIYEEITHLTGFNVKKIDVAINKILPSFT